MSFRPLVPAPGAGDPLPGSPAFFVLLFLLALGGCGRADSPPARAAPALPFAALAGQDTAAFAALRAAMVRRQIQARGVRDSAVLRVMRAVPRHRFVAPELAPLAYEDHPLPIAHDQTISQPFMVAFMAEAARLDPGDRVLEIGTGSGYGAAVLAGIAGEVYSIEIVPELAAHAAALLDTLGYRNIRVKAGNGWLGWPEHAPYDAIVVTAAPDEVPRALVEQLAAGGTLVVPVGGGIVQYLHVFEKTPQGLRELSRMPVRFVPMVRERRDTGG